MIEDRLTPLICERFLADEKYRQGHIRIINALPGRRILGLHLPEMKQLAKALAKQADALALLHAFEQEHQADRFRLIYEETLVWGLTINALKCSWEERISRLKPYIPVLDNWAVCDSFCAHAKWMARADKPELWAFLQPYFRSTREFEVRFAIVVAMTYFMTEEWLPKVFAIINSLDLSRIHSAYRYEKGKLNLPQQGTAQGPSPYYVRMGIAWLLATALAKHPDLTRTFIRTTSLPADVIKLYVRKARESFRTREVAVR